MADGTYPGAGAPYGAPRSNGVAVAALVCGLLALVVSPFPVVNLASFVLGIAAVVCGVLGVRNANIPGLGGRGIAITGVVTGALALAVAVLVYAAFTALLGDAGGILDAVEAIVTP